MNDTTTITPEERAKLISHINSGYMTISGEGLKRALAALEQAEAENAALKEDLESTGKSLKEYAGFFEQLCDGLKKRFPVQYATIEGDEYGDDAFSANDVFDHVLDPVIRGANEAEVARLQAELTTVYADGNNRVDELSKYNARLTKIVGNFASIEAGRCADSRTRNGMPLNDMCTVTGQIKAARQAVAAGE